MIRIKASGRSKYRAIKTVCGEDHKHASKKEAKVCDDLTLMAKGGVIHDLQYQPSYALFAYDVRTGKPEKVCTYVADFQYIDLDKEITLDVKGIKTPIYNLKKRFMKACYGIDIQEG